MLHVCLEILRCSAAGHLLENIREGFFKDHGSRPLQRMFVTNTCVRSVSGIFLKDLCWRSSLGIFIAISGNDMDNLTVFFSRVNACHVLDVLG